MGDVWGCEAEEIGGEGEKIEDEVWSYDVFG